MENPVGLNGMDFIEYTGPDASLFEGMFTRMGFKKVAKHKTKNIDLWRQGDIQFFINKETAGFNAEFAKLHGPSISSTGFRVKDAKYAFDTAVARGAKPYTDDSKKSVPAYAIYGIGDSLIYFVDTKTSDAIYKEQFNYDLKETLPGYGFTLVDHMTNNVPVGEMQKWCDFYEKVFNFKERRFFDIKGAKTGLISKVMRSPDGLITIPINEPTDGKSQIQEYIEEYKGSGIQHVALLTNNICLSVASTTKQDVPVLSIPTTYYEAIPKRLPIVTEDLKELEKLQIIVDGDEEGYLLQIFTQIFLVRSFLSSFREKITLVLEMETFRLFSTPSSVIKNAAEFSKACFRFLETPAHKNKRKRLRCKKLFMERAMCLQILL